MRQFFLCEWADTEIFIIDRLSMFSLPPWIWGDKNWKEQGLNHNSSSINTFYWPWLLWPQICVIPSWPDTSDWSSGQLCFKENDNIFWEQQFIYFLSSLNFPPSFQARGQQQLPAGKVGRDSKAENPAAQTQAQAATGEPLCNLHHCIFNPIWAYWACFAPGSTARHPFFFFHNTQLEMHLLEGPD